MGLEEFFGGKSAKDAKDFVTQVTAQTDELQRKKREAEEAKKKREIETQVSKVRGELEPSLRGAQRGLLSKQAQGRAGLVSTLSRLGVRGSSPQRVLGGFEAQATGQLASQEFSGRLQLNQILENIRRSRIQEQAFDESRKQQFEQRLTAQTSELQQNIIPDNITQLINTVAPAVGGAIFGPIGAVVGKGLSELGQKAARGIFGEELSKRALSNTGSGTLL